MAKDTENKDLQKQEEDGVGYKGLVEVGIVRHGKKYKFSTFNAGTLALFRYLCYCIIARLNPNYTADVSNRPGSLRLFDSSGKKVLSYGIPFADIAIEEDTSLTDPKCSVKFNFLIPGTVILGKEIGKVELRSIDSTITYANADFGDAKIKITDIDTNVYVSWTLTIKNQPAR